MSSGEHPLRNPVLDALRSLRHPSDLRGSPLLDDSAISAGLGHPRADSSRDDLALALSSRLKEIIGELRPPGEENLKQRGFLRYYILHYLFECDSSPLAIQHTLGISRSYFYQLRNEAVDNVATLLVATSAPATATSLLEAIPAADGFVGREMELAYYRGQLASQNLAVIHGFAGTGKSALAAQMATERKQAGHAVIWITFYPGTNTDIDSFIETLACALQELGSEDLRQFLAPSAQGSHPYPVDSRINYAANCLAASQATLCLDDVHLIEGLPGLQRFLGCLVPRQQPARLPLVMAGRTVPSLVVGRYVAPLPGLNDDDARQLISDAGLDWLEPDDFAQLQARIEGNAAFLKFFIAWARASGVAALPADKRTAETRAFIAQLGRSALSRSFLLSEVVTALDSVEQTVLERLALCRKSPDIQTTAATLLFPDLEADELGTALVQLERKNLLMRQGNTALYRLHDLMRNYLLARLETTRPHQRVELHRLLGHYYSEAGNIPEAAHHYCQAGDAPAATSMLIQHADKLVDRGQASVIASLADEVSTIELPPAQRVAWYSKLANVWQAAQMYDGKAIASLYSALDFAPDRHCPGRAALTLAREEAAHSERADRVERVDLSLLLELAEALTEQWAQFNQSPHQPSQPEQAESSPASAQTQKTTKPATRAQGLSIEAAGYLRALLMAREVGDDLAQKDALAYLGDALTELGFSREAAACREALALQL